MTTTIPFELDSAHRRFQVGGEAMVFHCHHYNTFLQRSILDASYIDSKPYLTGAAAEVSHRQLTTLFAQGSISGVEARKELAEEVYRWAGFGTVELGTLDEAGGTSSTPNSHYAMAWKAKFGASDAPVCLFASGWLAGAMAAIYDQPLGSYAVEHATCSCVDSSAQCVFDVTRTSSVHTPFATTGAGLPTAEHTLRSTPSSSVDYDGIFDALTSMEIVGNDEGHIPAFGVYLTRHYADYYNRISFETERAMEQSFGEAGLVAAKPLLVEAGHVCAFNTFGGIMTSTEWDALIKPSLRNDEDWVHGIVAAVNALGWGRWQVTSVTDRDATFSIHDDYESVGYLGMYGQSDHSVSHLAEGAAVGIMNLVYRGGVSQKPQFTPEFYDQLFKGEGGFQSEVLESKAMGDEVTTFRVFRG